jgi:hypothetical protein
MLFTLALLNKKSRTTHPRRRYDFDLAVAESIAFTSRGDATRP